MKPWAWVAVLVVGCGKAEPPLARESEATKPQISEQQAMEQAAQEARKSAEQAIATAREAHAAVEALEAEAEVLRDKLASAVSTVAAATDEQALAIAKQELASLQKEQLELAQRLAAAKAAAADAERRLGARVSKECQDHPLANGCR